MYPTFVRSISSVIYAANCGQSEVCKPSTFAWAYALCKQHLVSNKNCTNLLVYSFIITKTSSDSIQDKGETLPTNSYACVPAGQNLDDILQYLVSSWTAICKNDIVHMINTHIYLNTYLFIFSCSFQLHVQWTRYLIPFLRPLLLSINTTVGIR